MIRKYWISLRMGSNRILLLGHRGYLGSYLYQGLSSVYSVDTEVTTSCYDYFINCIGKPDLEFCEANEGISRSSNVDALIDNANRTPCAKIIHFSSYYVYDDVGLCNEESQTTDRYVYTRHKLEGEKFTVQRKGVCFRLGKLFGNRKKTQKKITDKILTEREIELDDVLFNPTSVQQVLDVILFEIQTRSLQGLYNLANDGIVSHYEYGKYLSRYSGVKITHINQIHRIFHNYGRFVMDTSKLQNIISLRPWQVDMDIYLKEVLCIV